MGSCMSLSSTSHADQEPNPDAGTRSSRRWKWGDGRVRGIFDKLVDPVKGHSRRGLSEDELSRIPGRMALNGTTGAACLFTQQGKKGTNQDAMVVWENFASTEDTVFCGVFDGHGPYGHMVARKVRDSLPVKVCNQWKSVSDGNNVPTQNVSTGGSRNPEEISSVNADVDWVESIQNGECEKFPEVYMNLRQSLLKAFKLMDKELKLHPAIDCFCSGSTAVTLIKQGHDIIVGNIGDSRAVLGTRDKNNTVVAVQLTVDLKPNLPGEAARIQQCRGRVFALQDEPEVPRVWLPNSDSPGLAMARAFGDFCLKDYGLISVPVISYRRLTDQDEFIVMATDGVWDVLSNKEVVEIVSSAPTRSIAARTLVDCAVREWQVKFPTSRTDDCAVICLFLKRPPSYGEAQEVAGSPQMPNNCTESATLGLAHEAVSNTHDSHPMEDTYVQGNALQEMFPAVGMDETPVEGITDDMLLENIHSMERPKEHVTEEEWTALDGVTRVNTLLNLPRFRSGDARLTGEKNSSTNS